MTVTISDSLIILATLLSPLIAVQVQKWIERATERRTTQRQVFYDLMATRATRIAALHVEALNRIDLEFRDKGKEREVLNRWRIYADHLNQPCDPEDKSAVDRWIDKSDELFVDLLETLASALGYSFDRVNLKRGVYYPKAHDRANNRREVFEEALVQLLLGNGSLNMRVTEFPTSEEAIELNRKVQEGILKVISDKDGALKTKSV